MCRPQSARIYLLLASSTTFQILIISYYNLTTGLFISSIWLSLSLIRLAIPFLYELCTNLVGIQKPPAPRILTFDRQDPSCSSSNYFWSSRSICTSDLTPSYDLGVGYLLLDFWFVSRDMIFNALLLWRWNIILQDVDVHPSHNEFPETSKKWPLQWFSEEVGKHLQCVAVLDTNYWVTRMHRSEELFYHI